jgi:hypothetical protein
VTTITVPRVVLEQALEWANNHGEIVFAGGGWKAVDGMNAWTQALRAALAQPNEDYERGFVDGMSEQAKRSVDRAVIALAQQEQEPGVCGRCGGLVYDPVVLQQEQEPVAWVYVGIKHDGTTHGPHLVWKPQHMDAMSAEKGAKAMPLYTQPPRREWRGLTMQEINALPEIGGVMWRMGTAPAVLRAIRAVERALKEKNS